MTALVPIDLFPPTYLGMKVTVNYGAVKGLAQFIQIPLARPHHREDDMRAQGWRPVGEKAVIVSDEKGVFQEMDYSPGGILQVVRSSSNNPRAGDILDHAIVFDHGRKMDFYPCDDGVAVSFAPLVMEKGVELGSYPTEWYKGVKEHVRFEKPDEIVRIQFIRSEDRLVVQHGMHADSSPLSASECAALDGVLAQARENSIDAAAPAFPEGRDLIHAIADHTWRYYERVKPMMRGGPSS